MKIGIIGLGLIGASMAMALKKSGHQVNGTDINKSIRDFALMAGSIDAPLEEDGISDCDVLVIAITPVKACEWLERVSSEGKISEGTLVIDCCGTKRRICKAGFALSREHGYRFVGGHPMAGKQVGGYRNSSADLFDGALFAIVPEDGNDIRTLSGVKSLMQDAGFTRFAVMTPEEHDQVIAFTSQMAHLISNAYIKSDMAKVNAGMDISGGAFRDMTRVAYLDQDMWAELFTENSDNLLSELDGFIGELTRYREAVANGDKETLTELLLEGKARAKERRG